MFGTDEWTPTEDSYCEERRVYIARDKNSTIESLAKMVELELSEFKNWGTVEKYRKDGKTLASVSVPNVWISVDALVGGSWYWDIPVVNPGGSIGTFINTDLFTYGKKIVRYETINQLLSCLQNEKTRKNIWGMVIYAHGNKRGYIGRGDDRNPQEFLIHELRKNNYKLAYIFLQQCYSGYKGIFKRENPANSERAVWAYLHKYFLNTTKNFKVKKGENGLYEITFDLDWKVQWGSVGITVNTYRGINALGVDLDIFVRSADFLWENGTDILNGGLESIEKGVNIIGGLFQKQN